MARNGSDVLTKKNSKLESFLKRNLDVDTFERIRTHEACIVCSEKEDKVFKFVVLSDERIYLTENPPKKISVEKSVNLRDVVSVELLNEYPEFLNGHERENTLHIVVKHRTSEPVKGKRRLSGAISAILTPRTARTSRSNSSESGYVKPRALPVFNVTHEDDKNAQKRSPPHRHFSDTNTSSSLGDDDDGGGWIRSRSCKEKSPRKRDEKMLTSSLNEGEFRQTFSESKTGLRVKHKSASDSSDASDGGLKPLSRQLPKRSESSDKNGRQKPGYAKNHELQLDLDNLSDSDEETVITDRNKLSVPSLHLQARCGSLNSLASRRSSTNDDPFGEDVEEEERNGMRETVLHLYIPDHTSPLLMLIQSAWNSCIIHATLEEDEDFCKSIPSTPQGPRPSCEQLETSFCELKSELLNPKMPMEELFNLVDELNSAAERKFTIKKLFWKTQELFAFIVIQLQKYLPKSPKPSGENEDEAKIRRADEFEYVVLLVETLQNMLQETDIIALRMSTLKAENGKLLNDLVVVLTCFAELPQKYLPPSRKAQALLNSMQSTQWKCYADLEGMCSILKYSISLQDTAQTMDSATGCEQYFELSKLVQEYNNVATATLYELILVAHQANWDSKDGCFFNVSWLVKVLERLSTTEKFVEKLISHAIRLISPSRYEKLQPAEAVLIFKQFHVLLTLVNYSPHIITFIRNNFYEEFKYYIQAPVIRQKLPKQYAIRSYIIKVMERVMAAVLQRKVTLLD